MSYQIKVLSHTKAELTYSSGELKFVADFYLSGRDWKMNGDDIHAECSGVDYELNPDFLLQNSYFKDEWLQIEGDMDYAASNWDGMES